MQIFERVDCVKEQMNACGAKGVPFLFAFDFELTEGIFVTRPREQKEILFQTPLAGNKPDFEIPAGRDRAMIASPMSYEAYLSRFDVVRNGLKRGNSFLTNLTVKTPVSTDLSLKDIFLLSGSPYQLYVPGRFVCFSPERFVRIGQGVISTNPMKGTINASVADAENKILSDYKETAEHHTIVDLLRNDLGMVAEDIRVERFRYIDRIKSREREILQVSSEITGKLKGNYCSQLGDLVFKMLPAGSVSGAPKKSTVQIIRDAEEESRGFYTGVFGYFDGAVLDSAVLIRYIEQDPAGQKYFRSGGGITVNSDPVSEYQEVFEKVYLPFV